MTAENADYGAGPECFDQGLMAISRQRLCDEGWNSATEPFWESVPCFYDLGKVKTVILFRVAQEGSFSNSDYHEVHFWKHGRHDLPKYLESMNVEIRRYKLHHSMNALLWHDHGNRPLWPA
jgi:hypothetical protein